MPWQETLYQFRKEFVKTCFLPQVMNIPPPSEQLKTMGWILLGHLNIHRSPILRVYSVYSACPCCLVSWLNSSREKAKDWSYTAPGNDRSIVGERSLEDSPLNKVWKFLYSITPRALNMIKNILKLQNGVCRKLYSPNCTSSNSLPFFSTYHGTSVLLNTLHNSKRQNYS